jgi:hypothetical protein
VDGLLLKIGLLPKYIASWVEKLGFEPLVWVVLRKRMDVREVMMSELDLRVSHAVKEDFFFGCVVGLGVVRVYVITSS